MQTEIKKHDILLISETLLLNNVGANLRLFVNDFENSKNALNTEKVTSKG